MVSAMEEIIVGALMIVFCFVFLFVPCFGGLLCNLSLIGGVVLLAVGLLEYQREKKAGLPVAKG